MPYFYTLILFFSLILLIIGLINPKKGLFWSKKPATRKKSSLIYGLIILLSFIGVGVTAPDVAATAENKEPTEKVKPGNPANVPPSKPSVKDMQIVNEIHTSLLSTLDEYETKPIIGLNLSQIEELHTYMNIERWNSGGDIGMRGGSNYERAAEDLQIPVSKIEGADSYYHYKLQPKLLELIKDLYKNYPNITLDYYRPLVSSAYCGINTLQGSIVLYGKKEQKEMEEEASQKAEQFMKDLPAWVTGCKLNYTIYKDTVLETKGNVGVGFLWKKGESIQKLKASDGLMGYIKPNENEFWQNDEWNNLKMISHPTYSYLKPQKSHN